MFRFTMFAITVTSSITCGIRCFHYRELEMANKWFWYIDSTFIRHPRTTIIDRVWRVGSGFIKNTINITCCMLSSAMTVDIIYEPCTACPLDSLALLSPACHTTVVTLEYLMSIFNSLTISVFSHYVRTLDWPLLKWQSCLVSKV